MRTLLLTSIGLVGVGLGGAIYVGQQRLDRRNKAVADGLIAAAETPTTSIAQPNDLDDLPAPIQRYMTRVLPKNQPHIQTVRMEQTGTFRSGGSGAPWNDFAATQHVTTRPPGFVWDASIRMLPGLSVRVLDAYADGEGTLRARLRHEVITEVEDGGLLDGPIVPGTDGGTAVGVGPIATWDTRDRVFYPQRGQFVTAYGLVHDGAFGGTYDFARGVLDARQYVPVGPEHVVALQGYAEAVSGTAPFTTLPQLGGMLRMRGYREGRFRDDVMASLQAEWRFPVWWRFDGALFAGTGAVSGRIGTFAAEGLEVAGGAGLRFRLNDAGVHLRLDYALGKEGGGLYITAAQPF